MGVDGYMRFHPEEFVRRCARARELMERNDLAGLFITEGGNYTYFSGGQWDFSFSRPHILLLPRQGDPVAVIQKFPAWNRIREIWFDDVRVYQIMTGLPVKLVADLMKEKGMGGREIIERFHRLLVEMGGVGPWSFINTGPENYNGNSGGPTDRRIRRSDQVWIDGGCTYREYASDFCCTGTVGQPSSRQRKMQEMVEEITRAVVRRVRPGIRACELDAINSAEWEKRGYDYREINWAGGRIGHGLGWGSSLTEPPHIASYDRTVIRTGMVITIEPGINTEYGCFQTEMDIAVTEEGCEILNEMDRGLRVIEG